MTPKTKSFEEEAARLGLCLKRREDTKYLILATREAWQFWCAAYEAGRRGERMESTNEQRQGRSSLAPVVPRNS